jgi:hypothetical protein
MHFSLHIAPVGLGPWYNQLNRKNKIMYFLLNSKTQFVTGPSPIPALTCPDTPELGIPSIHKLRLWIEVQPGVQPHLSGVSIRDTGAICRLVATVRRR